MTKFKKITILSIPCVIIAGSLATLFSISKINKNNDNTVPINSSSISKSHDIYKDVKIFPKINPNTFYSYLRMNSGSKNPIINDDMILFIAKYIIKNMNVSEGKIFWGFNRKNEAQVDIQVMWKHTYNNQEYSYSRVYSFSATNSI